MKELQNGRSMIEMLGVLAIIGVLSIGGLAGYTMAMNRHRANQILDYVSRCAVAAQTKGDGYEIAGGTDNTVNCSEYLPLEQIPNGLGEFVVSGAAASDLNFTIASPAIESRDIRTALIDRNNTNVAITGDVAANATDKTVTFTFKK